MADERKDEIQQAGRKGNAAQPLNAADDHGGPERYPDKGADPAAGAPKPRQGAGDGGAPASTTNGRMGPGGDPAEGKP